MKKSEIALIAAQTIDEWYDQEENGMCVAIMDVSCAPIEQRFGLMGELKKMFIPDEYHVSMSYWGWNWEDEDSTAKECRVLALCFLSAILESKGN